MAQTSYYWDNPIVGDAISQYPYSSELWNANQRILYTSFDPDAGVVNGHGNGLVVSGASGGTVSVDTGAAIVHGAMYFNNAPKTVVLDTIVTFPRIDIIVLKKDWATKQIRIGVRKGVENAVPVAPSVVQSAGLLWEIPIAQVNVAIGMTVTAVDRRVFIVSPLAMKHSQGQAQDTLATINPSGVGSFRFENIPQTYTHLQLTGLFRTNEPVVGIDSARLYLNLDVDSTHYDRILMIKAGGTPLPPASIVTLNFPPSMAAVKDGNALGYPNNFSMHIPNYTGAHHKIAHNSDEYIFGDDPAVDMTIDRKIGVWLDVSPVTSITLTLISGLFLPGCEITLYGIL